MQIKYTEENLDQRGQLFINSKNFEETRWYFNIQHEWI